MQALRLAQLRALRLLHGRGWFRRATALAEGWRILRQHPEVLRDLATLGHLYEPDIEPTTGRLYPPDELIARAARKSLVLMLLARAEVTHDELNAIRQESPYDTDDEAA